MRHEVKPPVQHLPDPTVYFVFDFGSVHAGLGGGEAEAWIPEIAVLVSASSFVSTLFHAVPKRGATLLSVETFQVAMVGNLVTHDQILFGQD